MIRQKFPDLSGRTQARYARALKINRLAKGEFGIGEVLDKAAAARPRRKTADPEIAAAEAALKADELVAKSTRNEPHPYPAEGLGASRALVKPAR